MDRGRPGKAAFPGGVKALPSVVFPRGTPMNDAGLNRYYQMSPTGITIAPDISFEDYAQLGEHLHAAMDACQWAIGGWAAFGQDMFGDDYTRAVSPDRTRRIEQTLWVWRSVPAEIRRDDLTFSHHRSVAGIKDAGVQKRLLDMAAANGWQVATLAAAVKRAKETGGEDLMPWQPVEPETATRLFGTAGVKISSTPSNDATNQIEKNNAPQLRVVGGIDTIGATIDAYPYLWAVVIAAREAINYGEITDALRRAVAEIDALE